MEKLNLKTLYFDYDGTLHDTMRLYKPAFMAAFDYLKEKGIEKDRHIPDDQIYQYLGYTAPQMWAMYNPDLDPTIRDRASQIITHAMIQGMKEGKAALFHGALETLKTLKERGYHLVFFSNCKISYMQAHAQMFGLDKIFDAMVCAEQHGFATKAEILKKILTEHPQPAAIVGDRHQDMTAGLENNIVTFACDYGYGKEEELAHADIHLQSITDLLKYL